MPSLLLACPANCDECQVASDGTTIECVSCAVAHSKKTASSTSVNGVTVVTIDGSCDCK